MGAMKNAYTILVGQPGGKGLFEKSRCREEDNIKMDLTEVGCEIVDWVLWFTTGTSRKPL
jgi:hypothetical protein